MILKTDKKEGETPLEHIQRLREEGTISDEKATYAGRLDPMASGEMIILTGEDVHKKEEYLGLPKEYSIEILFGFGTDTYDILGKITHHEEKNIDPREVKNILGTMKGKFLQEYPPYSSKTVDGKPLFAYAREGEMPEDMPKREVEIFDIEYLGERNISAKDLLKNIEKRIEKVKGDFRQDDILSLWRENLSSSAFPFQVISLLVTCGSGTYMRSLAHTLGQTLNIPALAFSIRRNKIGE